jgi:hypothetical protein
MPWTCPLHQFTFHFFFSTRTWSDHRLDGPPQRMRLVSTERSAGAGSETSTDSGSGVARAQGMAEVRAASDMGSTYPAPREKPRIAYASCASYWLKIACAAHIFRGNGRITLLPRHPRELVGPNEDAPTITPCDVRGRIRIRAGWLARQRRRELLAKLPLVQKVQPHDHSAVGALIGKGKANGRGSGCPVNIQPHHVVRVASRPGCSWKAPTQMHASRCTPCSIESLRLSSTPRGLRDTASSRGRVRRAS